MTGYGRAIQEFGNRSVEVEIKSLNSKYLDIKLKMPQAYREKEIAIRKQLGSNLERGKLEVVIDFKYLAGEEYTINKELFQSYYFQLQRIKGELGIENGDFLQSILRLPNIVTSGDDVFKEDEWEAMQSALENAMQNFTTFRRSEGSSIEDDFQNRVRSILSLLKQVDPHEKSRIDLLRSRLKNNVSEYLDNPGVLDQNRFEQEMLYYIEKMDINEEKVRLLQHCNFFLEQLKDDSTAKGRKLNFISQEMGREINTLGSKANSAEIQRIVVQMKDELEKIKEQIANVL